METRRAEIEKVVRQVVSRCPKDSFREEDLGLAMDVAMQVANDLQKCMDKQEDMVEWDIRNQVPLRLLDLDVPEHERPMVRIIVATGVRLFEKYVDQLDEKQKQRAMKALYRDRKTRVPRPIGKEARAKKVEEMTMNRGSEPQDGVFDCIVVGAGAAGLGTACMMQVSNMNYLVLEKNERVGDVWRQRYDRLHLHDAIDQCHLPLFPMPENYPMYPSKDEFADYLEAYSKLQGLNVKTGTKMLSYQRGVDGIWRVNIESNAHGLQTLRTHALLLCNGWNRVPFTPKFDDISNFKGRIVHSSEYKIGAAYRAQDVLVVGFGNSGTEICIDLYEQGAKSVSCLRRGSTPLVVVPRWTMGFLEMLQVAKPDETRGIARTGLFAAFHDGIIEYFARNNGMVNDIGVSTIVFEHGSVPIFDVGTYEMINTGKLRMIDCEGIKAFSEDGKTVHFMNGTSGRYDSIIFATGFQERGSKESVDSQAKVKTGSEGSSKHGLSPGEKLFPPSRIVVEDEGVSPSPDVGLFALYGRLYTFKQQAPKLAASINRYATENKTRASSFPSPHQRNAISRL